MTLHWETQTGVMYTVLYATKKSAKARWKIMPGTVNIPGTGRTIEFSDTVPYSEKRHYRLHVVPGSYKPR